MMQIKRYLSGKYDSRTGKIEYNGMTYKLNRNITTLLFIGVDDFGEAQSSESYNNNKRADFICLVLFDKTTRKYSLLHLNRDTMAEITELGLGGRPVGTVTEQLALAHTYGSGMEDSCRNTVSAVSNLLYGARINNYLSVTMDALPLLNDFIGGVTVEVLDDFEDSDILKKGNTVKLTGELALQYVRGRSETTLKTNIARMERQRQYIKAFLEALQTKLKDDNSFTEEVMDLISKYTVSNINAGQMASYSDFIEDYGYSGVFTTEGETKVNTYIEYYVDKDKLKQLVIDLFFVLEN